MPPINIRYRTILRHCEALHESIHKLISTLRQEGDTAQQIRLLQRPPMTSAILSCLTRELSGLVETGTSKSLEFSEPSQVLGSLEPPSIKGKISIPPSSASSMGGPFHKIVETPILLPLSLSGEQPTIGVGKKIRAGHLRKP